MTDKRKSTRDKKGWRRPYRVARDGRFFKRWEYGTQAVLIDRLPGEPIPNIAFRRPPSYPEQLVKKNLKQCRE